MSGDKVHDGKGGKWPPAAEAKYERVTKLGEGNFGAVWLAKERATGDSCLSGGGSNRYVAIKNINISKRSGKAYAEREIAVLSEMKHPNIIHLVKAYNPTKSNPNCRLVVMSLAYGPNLKLMVQTGGALGLPLARQVSRDLVAGISYLHGRAVVHRDIKTDNCVLARTDVDPAAQSKGKDHWKNEDVFWSDDKDCQDAVDRKKWRVVIVDFGMARALSPKDMGMVGAEETKKNDTKEENTENAALMAAANMMGGNRSPVPVPNEGPNISQTKQHSRKISRKDSVSRIMIKRLSALGSYSFAAPEISEEYRQKSKEDTQKTNSLTKCIADYGLIADAYSLGSTLREVHTGVPPNEDIERYISRNEDECSALLANLSCFSKKRVKKFRKLDEIPADAAMLVKKLSEKLPKNRITVREAQIYPWIAGGAGEKKIKLAQGDVPSRHGDPVVYLKCATDGLFDKT